jgi:hypothetical protein
MKQILLLGAFVAIGCAAAAVTDTPQQTTVASSARHERTRKLVVPEVELFFKGDAAWARRGAEEWALGDVKKDEMIFSPDKRKFAYVREKATASNAKVTPPAHVLVRNLAGDPINDFPVYRPGKPEELEWLDNHRIGYVAPADAAAKKPTNLYVVHDVNTGEVLAARSGGEFIWGPTHRHVAFVSGVPQKQAVVVDGQNVWPRFGTSRIHGQPVWSPDGHGLAFTEETAAGPRLVVLVEFDDAQGDLTWNVPKDALGPGLRVFWAGDNKVVIGESALKPRFAADWQRLR